MSGLKNVSVPSVPLNPPLEASAPLQRGVGIENLLKDKTNGIAKEVFAQIPSEQIPSKPKTWSILEKLSALGQAISRAFSRLFSCFLAKKELAPPLISPPAIPLKDNGLHSELISANTMPPVELPVAKNPEEGLVSVNVSATPATPEAPLPKVEEILSAILPTDTIVSENKKEEIPALISVSNPEAGSVTALAIETLSPVVEIVPATIESPASEQKSKREEASTLSSTLSINKISDLAPKILATVVEDHSQQNPVAGLHVELKYSERLDAPPKESKQPVESNVPLESKEISSTGIDHPLATLRKLRILQREIQTFTLGEINAGVKKLLDYELRLKEVEAQKNLPGSLLELFEEVKVAFQEKVNVNRTRLIEYASSPLCPQPGLIVLLGNVPRTKVFSPILQDDFSDFDFSEKPSKSPVGLLGRLSAFANSFTWSTNTAEATPLSRTPIQGIPNRGNACYRNSVFQALRVFPDFRAKMRTPLANPERPTLRLRETDRSFAIRIQNYEQAVEEIRVRESVRLALVKLLTCLENAEDKSSSNHASKIGEAELELRDSIFDRLRPVTLDGSRTHQQDAADYLSIVLKDVLGMALDFETTRRIPSGSQGSEVDSVAALRIAPRNADLQALISELFAESEGRGWNFENKRQPTYVQSSKIKGEPPSFIPVHIGRLQYSQLAGQKFRNDAALKIPKNGIVDLSSGFGSPEGACLYSIGSFVVHSGSAQSGHYIGYVKRADGWYECNDSLVNRISDARALELQRNAYILMLAKLP